MKSVLDRMRIQAINGQPMNRSEQRALVRKLGLLQPTPNAAKQAAAEAKRERKAAKLRAQENR